MRKQKLLWLVLVTCSIIAPSLHGQEFRIETQVFSGDRNTPISQNLTLFDNRSIYDFQMSDESKPLQIAIYDIRDRSFVLIDLERNKRMELSQVQLVQMVEGLRQQTSQNAKTKFLMDPLVENLDMASGWMTLTSPTITYRLRGERPKDASVLPLYSEFLDQFTRLKASDPTALPPFPRLKLNQVIKKMGWIPAEIKVQLKKNDLIKSDIEMKTTHTLINKISRVDRQRIESAKASWMAAKPVTLAEYRGLTAEEVSKSK